MMEGIKMWLDKSEFERIITNPDERIQAENFAKKGVFELLEIQKDKKTGYYHVNAQFRARYYRYHIKLEIDSFKHVVSYMCDCAYSSKPVACEHVGAVLLKLNELEENITFPYYEKAVNERERLEKAAAEAKLKRIQRERRTQLALNLLEKCQQNFDFEINRLAVGKKIKLCPQIESFYDHNYKLCISLSWKIGYEKLYMVRDLDQFLNRLKNRLEGEYGKNLTLFHDYENFDEDAQKQIDFIKRYYEGAEKSILKEKYIEIDENNIDDFFELFSSIEDCNDYYFNDEEYDLFVTADRIQEEDFSGWRFILENPMEYQFVTEKYFYLLKDRVLTRYKMDENGRCRNLVLSFKENELFVPDEKIVDFYKYVLSDLEENVIVEGLPETDLIPQENEIQLYGDIDEAQNICLTLKLIYDDHVEYGFNDKIKIKSLKLERIENILLEYAEKVDFETHQIFFSALGSNAEEFVQNTLPLLQKWCVIYVNDALRNLNSVKKLDLKVGIGFSHDLLTISLDSLEIEKEEILDVLKAYKRKKRFYRLKNGQMISLKSNELDELDDMFDTLGIDLNHADKNNIVVPKYRLFVADEMNSKYKNIQFERNEAFQNLLSNFDIKKRNKLVLKENYQNILRDYQKEGCEWIKCISDYGFGGILADDMGLGKTLQMIAWLDSERAENRVSLVVCPSSLLLNWQDEIHRFSDTLKCLCLIGSFNARKELSSKIKDNDVVIISYDYLRRDIDYLSQYDFFSVILDEAQYIKNQKTKNAQVVKKIKAKHHFALTGTPIENSLAELWSIFDFLMPGYLYSYHHFLNCYEKPIVKEQDEVKSRQLKKMVEPFILRRNKKEVLKELPEKIENTYLMSFEEDEQKLYLANLAQVNQELQAKIGAGKTDKIEILAMLTRLRQICCEPRMVYENIDHMSTKLKGCMELIQALRLSNHKILLFSSFTTVLEMLEKELDKENISYLTLTGKTDKETRRERVMQFQNDDTAVFLISLKAGGTGLNLTAAEAVIHYDPWWNISAQNQATDRAYRIGQNRNVQVFKLIMKDSIEERILELQEKKKNLMDTFVEQSEGSISSMSLEEISELLKI